MSFTSILKKVAMAFTGLALVGFLIVHLSGNLLILKGSQAFNAYAELLGKAGALLYAAEVGLILFFAMHIYSGVRVTMENRQARPSAYAVRSNNGDSTLASRTMAVGGIIIALFVVTHVKMFKYGDASGPGGLWGLVVQTFESPLMVAWYSLAMVALGMHLSHGFQSAFQSLGILKPDWRPKLRQTGMAIGWIIALGFLALPLWTHFYAHG